MLVAAGTIAVNHRALNTKTCPSAEILNMGT